MTTEEERLNPGTDPGPAADEGPGAAEGPGVAAEPGTGRVPIYLGRIDENAPVSGHMPPREHPGSIAASPEHDWGAAARRIVPLLRPAGTIGLRLNEADPARMAGESIRTHIELVVDDGPAGLVVAYSLPADGFDILVNGEHLVSWRVDAATIRAAALANLAAWSAQADWSVEASGPRRLLSSETGGGLDAARILLPEARAYLARELRGGRILVGVPDRHLLIAGSVPADDPEFGELLAGFVREQTAGAEEPIDARLFELVDGELRTLVAIGS